MKKILLLLIIPFLSFGQDLSVSDLKNIKNELDFTKLVLHNNFIPLDTVTTYPFTCNLFWQYGYNFHGEGRYMETFCVSDCSAKSKKHSNQKNINWTFSFLLDEKMQNIYFDNLKEDLKRCEFDSIIKSPFGTEHVIYNCENTRISFYIKQTGRNWFGVVENLLPNQTY